MTKNVVFSIFLILININFETVLFQSFYTPQKRPHFVTLQMDLIMIQCVKHKTENDWSGRDKTILPILLHNTAEAP